MADIEEIMDDISFARADAMERCSALVRGLIRLGILIKKAEKKIPRIEWDQWLDDTLKMTPRLAARYAELAEETTPPQEIAKRAILGALNLNIIDEIQIPDAHHIVKATDTLNRTLYIWPADDKAEALLAIVFDKTQRAYECCRAPLPASTAKEMLEQSLQGCFNFGNASYELMPARPGDLERFNDMLKRHREKALRQSRAGGK